MPIYPMISNPPYQSTHSKMIKPLVSSWRRKNALFLFYLHGHHWVNWTWKQPWRRRHPRTGSSSWITRGYLKKETAPQRLVKLFIFLPFFQVSWTQTDKKKERRKEIAPETPSDRVPSANGAPFSLLMNFPRIFFSSSQFVSRGAGVVAVGLLFPVTLLAFIHSLYWPCN